jgi:hypothetical protein
MKFLFPASSRAGLSCPGSSVVADDDDETA